MANVRIEFCSGARARLPVIRLVIGMLAAVAASTSMTLGTSSSAAIAASTPAVAPQYDTTHVYVSPEDFDRFVTSFVATFGGTKTTEAVVTVTPTPSKAKNQAIWTPVGNLSVFGFQTPVPYPFGAERNGYLVTDIDEAVSAAKANGADVLVAPFRDPIGKDAVIQWPGGVDMQLYWHTKAASFPPLAAAPENRVYVSPVKADQFIRDFLGFSQGTVESDDASAPGAEIGRPGSAYRRVRIVSAFGRMTIIVTEGFLAYPYGRENTGYDVADVAATIAKAQAAGATVLVPSFVSDGRTAAVIQFPGGYIAEIHAATQTSGSGAER